MHFASHRNFVKPASIGKVTIVKPASIGKATFGKPVSIGLFNLMAGNSLSGDRNEDNAATKSINISMESAQSAKDREGKKDQRQLPDFCAAILLHVKNTRIAIFFDAWHKLAKHARFSDAVRDAGLLRL